MRNFHKAQLRPINSVRTDSAYQNTMIQLMSQLIQSQHQAIYYLKQNGNHDHSKSVHLGQSQVRGYSNSQRVSPFRIKLSPTSQKIQINKENNEVNFSTLKSRHSTDNKQGTIQQSINNLNKKVSVIPSIEECIKKQTAVNELILKQLKILNGRQQCLSIQRPKSRFSVDKNTNEEQNQQLTSLDYKRVQGNNDLVTKTKQQEQKFYSRITDINSYSDKRQIKVKIDFTDMFGLPQKGYVNLQQKQLDGFIVQWLGVVYRATASVAWNNLKIHSLNFQEAKILFTQNIIYNFIELNKELRNINIRKQAYIARIVNSTSAQILDYLCKQYPQTKIQDPNIALRQAIPQIDEKGKLLYEQTSNCKPAFQYKQNKDYSKQIMSFINFLIDTTNKQYGQFEKFMGSLFEKLYAPIDKRGQDYDLKQLDKQGQAYRENAKKYTKYTISRKIPKNTPKFTQQQITSGVFSVKSPAILRILTKWVEQLMCVVNDPKFYVRNWYYMFKSHSGKEIDVSFEVKIAIYKEILAKRNTLYETLQNLKYQCYDMQGYLSEIKYITDPSNTHLSEQHINVGLFAINMKDALSIYMFKQLNEIIHFLLEIPKNIDEASIGLDTSYFIELARKHLDNINLVTCRIMDLLRCKVISSESEIIWLIKKMEQLHEDPNSGFQFVRVKDRLSLSTRDIAVNSRVGVLNNTLLVNQIQISIANQTDEQQDLLDKYNHFLYELKRSQFGPIIQNVSIWTNLQQRTSYFRKIYKSKAENVKLSLWTHECGFGYFQQISTPIICKNCDLFYAVPEVCFNNMKCLNCNYYFCGKCFYNCLKEQQKKSAIFKTMLQPRIFQKLTLFEDYKRPLPHIGFIIKKNYLKIDVQFFRVMESITPQQNEISIVATGIVNGGITYKKFLDLTIQSKQNTRYILTQQSRQRLQCYIIFEISDSTLEHLPLSQIIQKCKSDFQEYRFISFLEQTNYIKSLLPISKKKQKKKLLAEVNKSVNNNQDIAFMKLGQLIIFVQVVVPQQTIRTALLQQSNIQRLKKFAKQKSSIIWLENKKVTIEFISIKSRVSSYLYERWERKLKKLYLNGNQIQSIEFLETFKALQVIQIKKNKLKSLKGIENSTQLKQLKFSFNFVTSLQPLKQCASLEQIQANNNLIVSCNGIENLINLKQFEFHSNKISKFQKFEKLQKLEGMYFRNNPINSLTGILCIKNCLTQLIVSKVRMITIPKQMAQFEQLESLYFNENYLVKIENINTLKNLKKLSLRRNEIETMEGLEGLTLISLKLSTNKIKKIEGIDSSLQTLQQLALRQNPLEDCAYLRGAEIDFQISYTPQMINQNARRDLSKIIGAGHTSSGGSDSFA